MKTIYLNYPVDPQALTFLQESFPSHLFLTGKISTEQMSKADILLSNTFDPSLIEKIEQLQWMHIIDGPVFDKGWETLPKRPRLLTCSRTNYFNELVELMTAGILSIGHELHFCEKDSPPWQLENLNVLIVGLKKMGNELAKTLKALGCQLKGVDRHETFHPQCNKVFSVDKFHTLLPSAGAVCICPNTCLLSRGWFGEKELALMQKDAILAVAGNIDLIEDLPLKKALKSGKLKGFVAVPFEPPPEEIYTYPKTLVLNPKNQKTRSSMEALKIFRHNLRRFLLGREGEMLNAVS